MGKLVVVENLSLDGVMQAPGRADEDTRDGFERGGWATAYNDATKGRIMGRGMAEAGSLLFGRRTYEDFFRVWPQRKDNPFTPVLDAAPKYVASTTLREPLPWQNSTLLSGDLADAVRRLKHEAARDIVVIGSGRLVQSLMRCRLIDEYVLLVHPLVLGAGSRLFTSPGAFETLRLVCAEPTTTGVVITTYRQEPAAA